MTPSARDLDLRQHHGVETPEHVDVHFELAGVGSRLAAGLLDFGLIWLGLLLLVMLYGAILGGDLGGPDDLRGWAAAVVILLFFFLFWGYFVVFELFNGGRTPGKQALGIRVVMDTGRPLTPSGAVIRNLMRFLDCYFPFLPVVPALLTMFLHPSNKRLGDMAAGTIVVRDRPTDWAIGAAVPQKAAVVEPVETGPPELTEDEFRLLDRFLARQGELMPEVQQRIGSDLARRFEGRIPRRDANVQGYLVTVFAEEQRKRSSRFAGRPQRGGGDRFLAKKREGWEAFRTVAMQMERSGVGALAPGQIPAFAAQYRELAADLARARTYKLDPRVIAYLERAVAAGHNALYRARGKQRTQVERYVLRDFPAAVVESWRYVLLAFLLFAGPAAISYTLIRQRPELADELVPDVMISRAQQAAARPGGCRYAATESDDRPRIAALIMTNNVQVSFGVFVGGLTAGLLSAWLLFQNGVMIGLGLGVFENYGVLECLLRFVAGHGVLELTAIFISAGAGFRMAKAMIAPGDRTRRDALVLEGRVAIRMLGAVVTLLIIAGAIEGLLSTSDAPAIWKYGASALSAVFLAVYFASGFSYSRRPAESSSGSS